MPKLKQTERMALVAMAAGAAGVALFDYFVIVLPFWVGLLAGALLAASWYKTSLSMVSQEAIINRPRK